MTRPTFVPLPGYIERPLDEMRRRAEGFALDMARRRTTRQFADRPVPRDIIEACLRAAASAPSGANRQPWRFVVVSDPVVKRSIREAAEEEERAFYGGRAPRDWLDALAPLGTDAEKPYLEAAPWLIAVFVESYGVTPGGGRMKNYYAHESVGIATGLLVAAIHVTGLVSLTHTPSPMGFLNRVLGRPANERPFLLLVVGYPAADAVVPAIVRKPLAEVATFI
jgi:nitroreductase